MSDVAGIKTKTKPKDLNGYQHSFGILPAKVKLMLPVEQVADDAQPGLLLDPVF